MITPSDEIQRLYTRSRSTIVGAIDALALAVARTDVAAIVRAKRRLGDQVRLSQALADLHGRRRVWIEYDHAVRAERAAIADAEAGGTFALPMHRRMVFTGERTPNPLSGQDTFAERVRKLLEQDERVLIDLQADGFTSAAEWVDAIYGPAHGGAVSDLAIDAIAMRVRKLIEEMGGADEAVKAIRGGALRQWSEAYGDTAYRTAVNESYHAGRFQQATKNPDVMRFMPAMQYNAIPDSDVRRGRPIDHGENHKALDGVIASSTSRFWRVYAPPNGFNCRCSLRMVNRFALERMGISDLDIADGKPRSAGGAIVSLPSGGLGYVHPLFARAGKLDPYLAR